jgi:uncharacterized protein (TIGR00251 family)
MKTRLSLKVNAGAKTTEFAGRHGDSWKLKVAAPPVDGKANSAIVKFIAQVAGVSPSRVSIVSGETSTNKLIELEGIDRETLDRAILESLAVKTAK